MIASEWVIKNILSEILFNKRFCESVNESNLISFIYDYLYEAKILSGEPISVPELRKLLKNSIVNFEFIKLNGDVRPAKGTTILKYIPLKDRPKGVRPSYDSVATFFDLDKKEWRSVSKKSKEIVLKKEKEKDRQIVIVKDKEKSFKKDNSGIQKVSSENIKEFNEGDIRYYLNKNNENIIIRINKVNSDGSVYAETFKEKVPFKIPSDKIKIQNSIKY
ncbi:MAG TPA: SH3 beta-barrel fold-containing protein [Candidatus Diapherotrites archaeon]|nr:SH3 beta-barrel fold-containing protein [Candidatus Diapherotrites archaeon]